METRFTRKTFSKAQVSLLTKSMAIAGLAFILVGIASYGWSILFDKVFDEAGLMNIGLSICLITLFSSMIVSMLWVANMIKSGSIPLTIACYLFYIASTSVAFGWMFNLAERSVDATWLMFTFVIVGAGFLLATMIAKISSANSIMTMAKVIGIVGFVMSILFIVFLVLLMVSIFVWNPNVGVIGDTLCSIVMLSMTVVSFLYIVIDIWQISMLSEFQQASGQETLEILPWFCGFRLLTDLVNLVFIVIFWMLKFSRR